MFLIASRQEFRWHIELLHDLPHSHPKIFLASVLRVGCGCSTPIPYRFTPRQKAAVLVREDVSIPASVWTYLYRGSNLEPVWPVGSRYTDYEVQVLY